MEQFCVYQQRSQYFIQYMDQILNYNKTESIHETQLYLFYLNILCEFTVCNYFWLFYSNYNNLQKIFNILLQYCCQQNQKLSKFLSVFQIINIVLSITILVLYNTFAVHRNNHYIKITSLVNYLSAIQNFFSSFCIFLTQFYMNIILTGTLVQAEAQSCLLHLKKIQLCFFISRAVEGVYYILNGSGFLPYIQYIINKSQFNDPETILLSAILYIIVIFVTECLPIMISINLKTIKILEDAYSKNLKTSLLLYEQSGYTRILQEGSHYKQKIQDIKLNQFKQINQIANNQSGLGIIKKVIFYDNLFVMRTIEVQLSKYLIQEIRKEIQQKQIKKISALVNIKFSFFQQNQVNFISQYMLENLNEYMLNRKNLTLNDKLKVAFKISECIQQIHKLDLPHGSLKFNNIFISKEQCKLGDHGLLSLKKFMNLTKGYSNKSFYTAPQFLSQKTSIVSRPTKQGDIYSFGMIMFQIFTEITNYRTLNAKQTQKSFKVQETRPKIPQYVPNYLRNLIRSCWQQLPNDRPSIEEVRGILRQYSKN